MKYEFKIFSKNDEMHQMLEHSVKTDIAIIVFFIHKSLILSSLLLYYFQKNDKGKYKFHTLE